MTKAPMRLQELRRRIYGAAIESAPSSGDTPFNTTEIGPTSMNKTTTGYSTTTTSATTTSGGAVSVPSRPDPQHLCWLVSQNPELSNRPILIRSRGARCRAVESRRVWRFPGRPRRGSHRTAEVARAHQIVHWSNIRLGRRRAHSSRPRRTTVTFWRIFVR
jgi:hypothetical protein